MKTGDSARISRGADNDERIGHVVTLVSRNDFESWQCRTVDGALFNAFDWELEHIDIVRELRRRISVELDGYRDDGSMWAAGKKFALKEIGTWLDELSSDDA